jgi:hypothetical protein
MGDLVHAMKTPADKWHLGKTQCNRVLSVYTPVSKDPDQVTCKTCKRRMAPPEREDPERER